jgi:hypothetical protein
MILRNSLLACAGVWLTASGALAEPPIGSRLGERTERQQVKDQRDAAGIAHELAACALVTHAAAAHDLLNARDKDQVKKARHGVSGDEECFANFARNDLVEGVRVSYPADIMRGDIAEEIVKRQSVAVARLQPLPIQKTYSRSWFAFTGRNLSVDEMATCVAETDPAGVMALLDSTPQTATEAAAFSNLIPYMGPCLVAGTKLEGAREPLRAALAEALYQRMTNPNESIPAPTAPAGK